MGILWPLVGMHLVLVRPLGSTRLIVQLLRLRALPSTMSLRRRPTLRLVRAGSKATKQLHSTVGGKRKRGNFIEDEMLLLINMFDAVNNVANALRETCVAHVDLDIYLAVMEM